MRPLISIHDAQSSETTVREMTEEEYAALLESGWTPGDELATEPESTLEEETPTE